MTAVNAFTYGSDKETADVPANRDTSHVPVIRHRNPSSSKR
jgi:hypothetical protein